MSFCVLSTWKEGDRYSDVTAWSTEEEARSEAFAFLQALCPDHSFDTLEEIEAYCLEEFLGYVQLSFHILPTGDACDDADADGFLSTEDCDDVYARQQTGSQQ